MTSNNVSINPEKFEGFDSDVSDSEADCDEWVSISTSKTISTTSTLPAHLNLNPKATVKTKLESSSPRRARCDSDISNQRHNLGKTSGSTTPPRETILATPTPEIPPFKQSCSAQVHTHVHHSHSHNHSHNSQSLTPTALLKAYLPNLTAIYIVSRESMYERSCAYVARTSNQPFTRLSALGTSPISMQASSQTTDISSLKESYIRICAECAKPATTIYCDGTWTRTSRSSSSSSNDATCPSHAAVLRSLKDFQNRDSAQQQICTHCIKFDTDTSGRCVECDRERDLMLLNTVLKAVDPFRRDETNKENVRIFDMGVPAAGELYKHVEGCKCEK